LGNDTYIFNIGDQFDSIDEIGGNDTLQLGPGIGLADLKFSQSENDLTIEIASGVTIQDFFAGDPDKLVEQIRFEDGATFDLISLLQPSNNDPIAVKDFFDTDEGVLLSGNVLADNGDGADSDPDGDLLSVEPGTFATTDGGSVVLDAHGSFMYAPAAGFTGPDSFHYTLLDGNGGQDIGTVSIEVAPAAMVLHGGNADDALIGGAGDDQLNGGNGNDVISGGSGNDRLEGGNGNDPLTGGAGDDTLIGGNGHDRLFGDDGIDNLTGGNGDDILNSGAGNDHLEGGNGNDELTAGNGDDTLLGGNGADILIGGADDDSLRGGNGIDTFAFQPGFGNDTIEDFRTIGSQHDKLQFGISLFANETHLFASSADTADGVLITADAGDTLLIKNTTVAELQAHPEDFHFV
jgi:Ca2+-binding RTX toxin-like protein